MSSPVWNKLPAIAQNGDTLILADRGDWTTQEGSYPARTCVLWQRLWGGRWEDVGGSVAPKRERPEVVLPGERAANLKIGQENVGIPFRVQVWAGVQSDEWDDGSWVEWGSDRSTRPTPPEYAYSPVITVISWQTAPPPPVTPSAQVTRGRMVDAAKQWEAGRPQPLARITVAREILELPDHTPDGRGWLQVRDRVRAAMNGAE